MKAHMIALVLLAAAPQPAEAAQAATPPPFVTMLGKARVEADCYQRHCPAVPVIHGVPSDRYSTEFRRALVRFLLDVRFRGEVDPEFSMDDRDDFQVALNVLNTYLICLDERFQTAGQADYTDRASVDRLATRASDECREKRVSGLRLIEFEGPDFVDFDLLRDGGKPKAEVSELLRKVQDFAIAYHAGRRGVQWSHAVAMHALPAAVAPDGLASPEQ